MLLLLMVNEDLGATPQIMDAAVVFIELLDNTTGVDVNTWDSL
jgi:hypothetical protein